ncbi:PREDICTED: uncharacterized protein LOC109175111 [Ipomoea nil]|uniref:uncharacterized protein LOC109175111 n=1 Tax=Ipomoea nil TaxID=35883 RepID=UPI000901EB2D|nr:PREDICTED: uncharacterized protein LOC109175111 [Ipomoea nil]
MVASVDDDEPTCHSQAVKSSHWRAAMDTEFNALLQNQTWRLVPPRRDVNVIGSKWVFCIKRKSDGTIDRYKARLVAKGFNQVPGEDYSETYSPVVKQPPFGSYWLSPYRISGLCVRAYVLVYVDDILLLGNNSAMVETVMAQLSSTFRIRDLGRPRFFLGVEATYSDNGLMLSQQRYMNELLRKASTESCKPLSTPMALAASTPTAGSPPLDDPTPYRCLVGSLMYLLITRPDLAFSVNRLCQFMHTPTQDNWASLKRVLRYVQGTQSLGLRLTQSSSPVVHAFSDSDWAGCSLDRKSTAGYAVFLGPNLVSWTSRKQRTVARSSTEAEYKALANVAAEHVEVDYHFVRDKVSTGALKVNFVSTNDQLADIFTKPLSSARFGDLRCKLGVVPCPASA